MSHILSAGPQFQRLFNRIKAVLSRNGILAPDTYGIAQEVKTLDGRVLEPEVVDWEGAASAYDEINAKWGDVILQGFAESALRMGVREGRVLDVGTGPGRIAIRLAKMNPALSIEAIDLSEPMLELSRRNARQEGVHNVRFSKGDAKKMPYSDQTFDLVICHQVLHELPDPLVALQEIVRVVKSEGGLLVRDIRRLPEPMMTLALPFWCFGYGPQLRESASASFRAALTLKQFRQLVRRAGIRDVSFRTHFLTHQTMLRPAKPYQPPPLDRLPKYNWRIRALKSWYVSDCLGLVSP